MRAAQVMVQEFAAYRFLPPGGRVRNVWSAIEPVVASGAAHEIAALDFDELAAGQADVIVNPDVRVLDTSESGHVDGWLAELQGKLCRELQTNGDGACAMHATFGEADATKHELFCPQPRVQLRALLGQPLALAKDKVRPSHIHLLDAVVSSLWADFVVPYAHDLERLRPREEDMFWERMHSSPSLDQVLEQVKTNRVLQKQLDDLRAIALRQSASIFKPALNKLLWARLASQSGLMPSVPLPNVSEPAIHAVAIHEDFDFLKPPWEVRNNECLVKGTNLKFQADENGGPVSKKRGMVRSSPRV